MSCDTKKFPVLPFCGPHPKPHVSRRWSKHYYSCFDQKLGHGICVIHHIPCACVACTSMLDTPWISVIPSKKKGRYQHFTYFTDWKVWNIIHITPKPRPFESFDEIHPVILDGISDNISSLVQPGMYGVIQIYDTTTNE